MSLQEHWHLRTLVSFIMQSLKTTFTLTLSTDKVHVTLTATHPSIMSKKKKSSNITTTLEWCVYLLCLCVTAAQHCNIGFGEPPLNPTEFSQPPVLLLLQNCDHIIFGEVEMAVRLCSPRAQSLSLHIPHHLKTHSKCHCIPQGSCILHKHYVVILKESCIPVHGWKRQSLWHELG